ncbi:hypothetical protein QFZ34_001237 [Phyllobacterium ifriqiyense]|uniref:Uncharacterized protein n=1 Tax=Phyllobacterium ifriqiyense TaxID=314238 RepID=A0ABU0S5N2_9HYPH|nr:hypothetical protein [Phyllobacterium ifriqiyense]
MPTMVKSITASRQFSNLPLYPKIWIVSDNQNHNLSMNLRRLARASRTLSGLFFHVGQCPSCRQGWLILQRNLSTGDIYAHCEECETGFITPGDLWPPLNGFLIVLEEHDDETENPSKEISITVWTNFIVIRFPLSNAAGLAG